MSPSVDTLIRGDRVRLNQDILVSGGTLRVNKGAIGTVASLSADATQANVYINGSISGYLLRDCPLRMLTRI
jgi:hypothetical protein